MKRISKKAHIIDEPKISITNCHFENHNETNEQLAQAIIALSGAAKANADAIAEIAKSLRGTAPTGHMINISELT